MASRDEDIIRLIQGPHTDAVQRMEDQVIGEAVGDLDDEFTRVGRDTTALWTRLFGGPRADAGDDALLGRILAAVREAIARLYRGLGQRSGKALERALSPAVSLGVAQGAQVLSLLTGRSTKGTEAKPSRALRRAAGQLSGMVEEQQRSALALLKARLVRRLGLTGALAAVGRARGVVGRLKAAITHTVNEAVNEGVAKQIRNAGAQKMWINERDSCVSCAAYAGLVVDEDADFPGGLSWDPNQRGRSEPIKTPPRHPNCLVGSVRVAGPIAVVAGDEASRLAPRPPLRTSACGRNAGLLPAPAMTETVGDFGRSRIRAASVREYVGQVVTIRTTSGKELTGTPNHPVATRRGWVGLAELHVGDHVITSAGPEWETNPVHPDVDHIPPSIEDVAHSLPVALDPMPLAAEDFHGDGVGSEVYVVRTDGLLRDDFEATGSQVAAESDLGGRDVDRGVLLSPQGARRQALYGVLLAAARSVGSGSEAGSLGGLCLAHALEHRLTSIARSDAAFEQTTSNRWAADAEDFCESLLALPGFVATDEIVHVNVDSFHGHVYNLETSEGWYIGNGIVTHNCRCRIAPWKDEWAEPGVTSMPEALRREAWRSIARGWSLPTESNAARIRAARELLRSGVRLPKSVLEFAADAVRAGRFADRTFPATGPGAGR